MKTITKYYLVFFTICLIVTAYFFLSNEYFYTIPYYDTYYHVSYFYFSSLLFLIGSLVFLIVSLYKRKPR